MKIETLELKGFIYKRDEDVYLEEKKVTKEYYYPDADPIGEIVSEHFKNIKPTSTVSPTYDDWTRGDVSHYKDVFVQYFICDKETAWDKALEDDIRTKAGDMTTEKRYAGYSEYTITDSWTEIFVGGHDLREELMSHDGKYAIVRINYKVKD